MAEEAATAITEDEVRVKKTAFYISLIIIIAALGLTACNREERAGSSAETETIAPAEGQPAPTGTEAMTQTVNIEDGRSEAEGGIPTETTTATATTTATGLPATTTNPPAKQPSQSTPPARTQ